MTIKEALKSPLAKVSAGITGILAVLNPDVWIVALDAMLASAPQLFSVASVGALTLPQVLPPQTTTDWVVVGAGVLFVAYSLRTINQKFDERGL
jgi:formaldehyde-activating enzyme involved in methanogenesis